MWKQWGDTAEVVALVKPMRFTDSLLMQSTSREKSKYQWKVLDTQVNRHTQLSFYTWGMFRCLLSNKLNIFHRIMHAWVCVREKTTSHQQHQQHINYVLCLPGGRQALGHVVCWRPQLQAAIPQQRLHGTSVAQGQHMRGRTHTKKKPAHHSKYWTKLKHAHLPFGYIFIKHLWPQKKKAEGTTHTDIHAHTKTAR